MASCGDYERFDWVHRSRGPIIFFVWPGCSAAALRRNDSLSVLRYGPASAVSLRSPCFVRGPADTLSYAVLAALKPGVTIPGHPRNACVTPLYRRSPQCCSPMHWRSPTCCSPCFAGGPGTTASLRNPAPFAVQPIRPCSRYEFAQS
jgi:hypothetical protein